MSRASNRGVDDSLARLRAEGDRRLSAKELADIIGEVAQTLTIGSVPPGGSPLRVERPEEGAGKAPSLDRDAALAALAGILDAEADGGPLEDIRRELDEIRAEMQQAAATFLSVAEAIEDVAGHPDLDLDDQDELYRRATSIFETAGFQDFAGQRLTRAADMLRRIELAVLQARAALGDPDASAAAACLAGIVHQVETRKVERILHGPQNAGSANTQEEIDKILASFD